MLTESRSDARGVAETAPAKTRDGHRKAAAPAVSAVYGAVMTSRRIAVFGMGYVGCVSAACLASRGNDVIGVDVSRQKVALVNEAQTPVVEERIGELVAEQVDEGRLRATTDAQAAVAGSDIALVCV